MREEQGDGLFLLKSDSLVIVEMVPTKPTCLGRRPRRGLEDRPVRPVRGSQPA